MKKKVIIWITIIVLSVIAVTAVYAGMNRQTPHIEGITPVDGDGGAAFLISRDGIITVNDSIRFRIDTGQQISTLTAADRRRLEALGIETHVHTFPWLSRSIDDKMYFASERIDTSIPVFGLKKETDSEGINHYSLTDSVIGYVSEVVFRPAASSDTISTIGIDILEHFAVEYQWRNNILSLRQIIPGNYQFVSDIESPLSFHQLLGLGNRYYLSVSVQNRRNLFFIDTGIEGIDLKLPASDTMYVSNGLQSGVFASSRGSVKARYTDNVWVKLGNRHGTHSALYGVDGNEPYAINPLYFYTQDIIIDFPGRKLYLHPHSR